MTKRKGLILLVLVIIGIIIGIKFSEKGYTTKPYIKEDVLFDTYVTVKAFGENKGEVEKAVEEAFKEMKRIQNLMDFFNPESEVSKINQSNQKVKISQDTAQVIKLSLLYGKKTNGAFNIAVGPLVSLWNFGEGGLLPEEEELNKALSLVDLKSITLGEEARTVQLLKPEMKIDLGGIAKGYATDKAIEILKRHRITQALVTTGSTTKVIGLKPDKKPWQVGIEHPRDTEKLIGVLSATNESISTSGDYQRYFEKDNKRYHHILNPKTGMPAKEIMSVTVVTKKSCAEADILSTAIFVMGYSKGMDFVKKEKGLEAVIVTLDGKVHISLGLKNKIKNLLEEI